MWQIEIRHDGLNKYRIIRGKDKYVVEQKAAVQRTVWDEMWQRKLEKEQKLFEKEQKIKGRQAKNQSAIEQTREATEAIKEIENVLKHTLTIDDRVDWEVLKDKSKFPKSKPQLPQLLSIPPMPKETHPYYQPKLGFFDKSHNVVIAPATMHNPIPQGKVFARNKVGRGSTGLHATNSEYLRGESLGNYFVEVHNKYPVTPGLSHLIRPDLLDYLGGFNVNYLYLVVPKEFLGSGISALHVVDSNGIGKGNGVEHLGK